MTYRKKIEIPEKAIEKLKAADNRMKLLIEFIGEIERYSIEDPFTALVNSIIYQQLSMKAANSIWDKFTTTFTEITPNQMLTVTNDTFREIGLSNSKIKYIRNIAEAIVSGKLTINQYEEMTNDAIRRQLLKVKGIGPWTVEMFLIFSLRRENILSYGDLGLRKGIKWLYNLNDLPSERTFEKYKRMFSPYGTYAAFYLWEISLENLFKYPSIDQLSIDTSVMYYNSPIGLIEIQSKKNRIFKLSFVEEKLYEPKTSSVLLECIQQLEEYFNGKRKTFELPLIISGTDFREKVWNTLLKIPYGETNNYKEIALKIGKAKAARAVGGANNKNRIGIIIPCHRVIGSNGQLTGYAGGIEKKRWLLDHEAKYRRE